MLRPPPAQSSDLAFASISRPPTDEPPAPQRDDVSENHPNLMLEGSGASPLGLHENLNGAATGNLSSQASIIRLGSFRAPPRPPAEAYQGDQGGRPSSQSVEYSNNTTAQMPELMQSTDGELPPQVAMASQIRRGNFAARRPWKAGGAGGLGASGLFGMSMGGSFGQPNAALTYEQFEEIRKGKEKAEDMDEEELDSQWFALPSNTYGAAIWATLILHIEAIDPQLLFKPADDDTVPFSQTWDPSGDWKQDTLTWFALRFTPFMISVFFQVSLVGLCIISFLLQFGFTYLLDIRIGGSEFFDLENAPYICGTPGSVQLISIGFFMCFMLGQVPAILKNMMLIWTSDMVTDEDDGVAAAKSLLYSQEWMRLEKQRLQEAGILRSEEDLSDHELIKLKRLIPAAAQGSEDMSFLLREPTNHNVRKEFTITIYLLYVGCKYIFYSGFMSLEQEDSNWFPSFPLKTEDGIWPWMSETNGVEEIIMATLALQFIMDIDEALFSFVLPKSVQASVEDTRLKCFGWLPGKFKDVDYRRLGQRSMERMWKKRREDLLGLEKLQVLEEDEGKQIFKEIGKGGASLYYRLYYDAIDTAIHCLGRRLLELMQERAEKRQAMLDNARSRDDALASQGSAVEEKIDKQIMEDPKFIQVGKSFFEEIPQQLAKDLQRAYSGEPGSKEDLEMKLLHKVNARLRAVAEHDRGMPYLLSTWQQLNARFDLHQRKRQQRDSTAGRRDGAQLTRRAQELLAKKVRLRWLNLLPDATFLFFFTIIFVPVIMVGLIRSKVGCYSYREVKLSNITAGDTDTVGYWGGVTRLSPLMVFFVLIAGWRLYTFLRNLYKLKKMSQKKQDSLAGVQRGESQLSTPSGGRRSML